MERFGFIHEKLDIKILILFVLNRLNDRVDANTLTELCLYDGGISYFDYAECLSELVNTGHIDLEGRDYVITEKGRKNGEITESSVPYSVRVRTEREIAVINQQLKRSSMIRAESKAREDGGYTVELSMSDGLGDVLSVSLFAGDEAQAQALCQGFKGRAEEIYGVLINEILKG